MTRPKISKNKKLIFAILIVTSFLFFVFWRGESIRFAFINFFSKIQKKIWVQGKNTSSFVFNIFKDPVVQKENELLKKENQSLLFQLNQCNSLKEENEELRTLLSLRPNKKFEYVDAQIIGKAIDGEAFFINKGLKDNIKEGQTVINKEHVFLGKIERVDQQNSLVRLLTDRSFKINIEIGPSKIEGVAKGGVRLYSELPKEKEIEEGALVITGRLQKEIPQGLLIGKVLNIKKTDLSTFQQIEIKPFFNPKELERLFVIISF